MPRRSLTPEERRARSDKQLAYWARIRAVAKAAGVNYVKLAAAWQQIKPIADDVLAGNALAIAMVKGELRPMPRPTTGWRGPPKPSDETRPDIAERVKIMMWAIKTCGGAEEAAEAFDRAIQAVEH